MTTAAGSHLVPEWTLADRLRKAREVAGLTQGELAKAIGISQRSVSAYESEGTSKRPVLLSWAVRCGVSADWLARGTVGPHDDGPLAQLVELRTFNPRLSERHSASLQLISAA